MVSLPVCHLLLVEIERNQSSPPWSNELASPGFFHDTGVAKWKRQSEIKTILQKVNLKSQDQNRGVRTLSIYPRGRWKVARKMTSTPPSSSEQIVTTSPTTSGEDYDVWTASADLTKVYLLERFVIPMVTLKKWILCLCCVIG